MLKSLSLSLNKITFDENTIATTKNTKKINAILSNDKDELNNLYGLDEYKDVVSDLKIRLKELQTEYKDDITIKRVWTFIAPNKGFLLRIIDYMSFMFTSFISAARQSAHGVWPTPGLSPPGV